MSRKYIAQINNENFVFPNNRLSEYDININHDLNENSVTGTTTGLSMSVVGANLQFSFTYDWYKNNAETFITNDSKLSVLSVHLMTPDKKYESPWIMVSGITSTNLNATRVTDTQLFVVTPAMAGVTSWTSGIYYVMVKFIGHRSIFPTYMSASVTTGTPTPTPTPGGCLVDNVCMEFTVTGATAPEGPYGEISYNNCSGVLTNEVFTTNGTRYRCVEYTGGLPQIFTYSRMTEPQIVSGNCNTFPCGPTVTFTPTPTPTSTPTSTPTPTPTATSIGPTFTPTPTPTSTPIPPTFTPTPTPTPTATPIPPTKYLVEPCGGGDGPYIITLGSGDTPSGIGQAFKLSGGGYVGFNGTTCWTVLEIDPAGSVNYSNVGFGTVYSDCVACLPTPTPTPTPTGTPTPTPTVTPTATPVPQELIVYTGSTLSEACSGTTTTTVYHTGALEVGTVLYLNSDYTNPVPDNTYLKQFDNQVYYVGIGGNPGEITSIVACPTPTPTPTPTATPSATYSIYRRCGTSDYYNINGTGYPLKIEIDGLGSSWCAEFIETTTSPYGTPFTTAPSSTCDCD